MKTRYGLLILLTIMCLKTNAQQPTNEEVKPRRQFTLEDLNFGGKNYEAMSPQTLKLWWDGNTLVKADEKPAPTKYPKVFTKEHNIYIQVSEEAEEKQVTTDGTREIVYGESVHRNEFGITEGIFMSPDRKKFAFYRMDQSMVSDYPLVNTFERVAVYEPEKYPMAGMTSHKVSVGIYDIETENTTYLDLGDTIDRYFTNIAWAPDNNSLYIIEVNRKQNEAKLDQYSASNGKHLATLNTETDEKYVEPQHPISFLPWDSSKFLMWSQKDGYWHLYLMNTKGKLIKQLTKGPFVVMEIMGYCVDTKSVIIRTNELSPLQSNFFSVNIRSGKRVLLDNGVGVHRGKLSEDGSRLLDSYTTPDVPRAYNIIEVKTKKTTEYFRSKNPWEEYAVPHYRQGSLKAADGKTDLYYRMVLPPDFEETKKYPTVVYVYGGSHAHNIDASWHWNSRSWETYMAQKGYIVYVMDNRGSENRGKEFEQVTFHQMGQVEMLDQMKGVDYLRSLPYVDSDRLGVHGWSFGGFMTISLMVNYPDVFKVGVAGGAVIDWKYYEVMYGERYMGTPEDNAEGYEKTSLLSRAKDLKGRLLMIHGMNDPVVLPQHAMQFLDACNKADVYPDFYVYPGEGHNMKGHMSVHLHEKITRYFEDYLK
ncbi:MAG: DPP IV N-terminal domain-containing protein [Prevotella sp.]|nr:DPP IV N-terminal domain-containing protein [Prevotella sp.]